MSVYRTLFWVKNEKYFFSNRFGVELSSEVN